MINIINQIIDIENKLKRDELKNVARNFKRLMHEFETKGYKIVNPIGKEYDYRDSAIEANILTENALIITKVIKPIIYKKENDVFVLLQKGIVIVA